ncbi:ogr/Delta-like zinc finger family protein [Pseudomonas sp. 58(2021)]|uniref:ogr/Delta-like zinc finger family protein n=1 Tax=Pseudomonas sp. 58(2021) TaxID=2813330 RepID=UPI001A9FC542|nr:ogr/Delta-like zinc finger family protein [Pseudomonas sp. 58(2021)]
MRVKCKCGSKGAIRNTKKESSEISALYCQCLDVNCGMTWVAHLTYSHTLKKPLKPFKQTNESI